MKIEQLKPGQIVWHVMSQRMGNTTLSTMSLFSVKIIEVNPEQGWALVSWNGNQPEKYYSQRISRLRKNKPLMVTSFMGRQRLATRKEIKAATKEKTDVAPNRASN